MDIIKEVLKQLDEKERNSIYLREIALLMEEIDSLKERLGEREKLINYYQNKLNEEK